MDLPSEMHLFFCENMWEESTTDLGPNFSLDSFLIYSKESTKINCYFIDSNWNYLFQSSNDKKKKTVGKLSCHFNALTNKNSINQNINFKKTNI